MKRKIVLVNLVLLLLCLPLKAEETTLSQEEVQAIFLEMEKTFLSRFDKVCIHVELDEIPLTVLALQHDMLHQEAVVLRQNAVKSGPLGYFIELHSIMANFEELPKLIEAQPSKIKSLNLWSEPVFSSPFKMGDFIPSLLLQVRFMQNPDETINGTLQHVMMGLLPIGDGGKYQKLKVYIDATENLPTGFDFYNGLGEVSRSVRIMEFGIYEGKKYAKNLETSNLENGQKGNLEILHIGAMVNVPVNNDLSGVDQNNWKNYCSGKN